MERTQRKIDFCSDLPQHILHRIMSQLASKQAAKTSVLSKSWYAAWLSFLMSDFDDSSVQVNYDSDDNSDGDGDDDEDTLINRHLFVYFVGERLRALCNEKRSMGLDRFKLSIRRYHLDHAFYIDEWVPLAITHHVKSLHLHILSHQNYYALPSIVYTSRSLQVLELTRCNLGEFDSIPLLPLKQLSLSFLESSQKLLHDLIHACPSLEQLCLNSCYCLLTLKLRGFTNLKKVKIIPYYLEMIDIELECLEEFTFIGYPNRDPCDINMSGCKNLKVFELKRHRMIAKEWLQPLLHNFQLLQSLVLHDCPLYGRIRISGHHLRCVEISSSNGNLGEYPIVNAPNLELFSYAGDINSFLYSMETSHIQIANFKLYFNHLNTRKFFQLKELLANYSQAQFINLHINPNMVKFQQKDMTSTPICGVRLTIDPTMKLEGRTVEFSIDYQALVDGLLWSIQPEILSLKLDCKPNIQFLEVLCRKLGSMRQESCCKSTGPRCWVHHLRHVKIVWGENTTCDSTEILKLLPAFRPFHIISFQFKW